MTCRSLETELITISLCQHFTSAITTSVVGRFHIKTICRDLHDFEFDDCWPEN